MGYVKIDGTEMEEVLEERIAGTEVDCPRTKERVWDVKTPKERLRVRVFSSIDKRTNESRDCGEDAIRVVMWDVEAGKPIGGEKRTHRTPGWDERMVKKIAKMLVSWRKFDKTCPSCGSSMAQREGPYGEFWGCTSYPNCKQTAQIEEASA